MRYILYYHLKDLLQFYLKDSTRANEAAHLMKLTAEDLKSFGIIDEIILEGKGLNTDPEVGYTNLKKQISKQLTKLMKTPVEKTSC